MNPFPNLHDGENLEKLEEAAKYTADLIESGALIPGTEILGSRKDDGTVCPNCAMGFIFYKAGLLDALCPDDSYFTETPSDFFERYSPLAASVTSIYIQNDCRPYPDGEWRKKLVWHIRDFARECARELEAK